MFFSDPLREVIFIDSNKVKSAHLDGYSFVETFCFFYPKDSFSLKPCKKTINSSLLQWTDQFAADNQNYCSCLHAQGGPSA